MKELLTIGESAQWSSGQTKTSKIIITNRLIKQQSSWFSFACNGGKGRLPLRTLNTWTGEIGKEEKGKRDKGKRGEEKKKQRKEKWEREKEGKEK